MVRRAFSVRGCANWVVLKSRIKAEAYIDVLHYHFPPIGKKSH